MCVRLEVWGGLPGRDAGWIMGLRDIRTRGEVGKELSVFRRDVT